MEWQREANNEPIPGYTLVSPLGTGGFGEVWKCIAPGGIHKAIKFVYGNLEAADSDSEKAHQEYSALERVKSVRHPFVLSMDRIEVVKGELLIVMELADKSLYDLQVEYQQAGRPGIPRDLLLGFLSDAAEGLDHLIEKYNLLHLDVKPKNLFLIADRVKVADFGLVKTLERSSTSGALAGITPVYAAPETFSNKINKHSDQYSLAIVYAELLTGQRVFNGKNIRQLAVQHLTAEPDLSSLPVADKPILQKALSKDPENRFPSCSAFIRALVGGSVNPSVTGGRSAVDIPGARTASKPDFDFHELGKVKPQTDVLQTPGPISFDIHKHNVDKLTLSAVTASQLEPAALRPALMIGVGTFGRRALQQIRGRLLDRLGDLKHVPCIKFLYIDPDPDCVAKASHAGADVALTEDQVLPIPLQPVQNYRRKHLDQVMEWLPREKLYAIPRNLAVDGSRALGRLAFSDHYLRISTRLRHDLQAVAHPEAIARASLHTGLAPRDKSPIVYIFTSGSGGTGGMTLDLGHAVKKALERLNLTQAPVVAFVFSGSPNDAGTPASEAANIYATISEMNHFADTDCVFRAAYAGPEGPTLEGRGLPFTGTYLLSIPERTGEAFRDCLAHVASYVVHDLTTPFGTLLEKIRTSPIPTDRAPFRTFGTFGVWYPRGLVLRTAARKLCTRVVQGWLNADSQTIPVEASVLVDNLLANQRLTPGGVVKEILAASAHSSVGHPGLAVENWIQNLRTKAGTAASMPDANKWAAKTWLESRELLGTEPTAEGTSTLLRGKVSKALDVGIKALVESWTVELAELVKVVEEMPGLGLNASEAVWGLLCSACKVTLQQLHEELIELADQRGMAQQSVAEALEEWPNNASGFMLFGKKITKTARAFADTLAKYAALRLKEDETSACIRFYTRLADRLTGRLKDLESYRERLCDFSRRVDDLFTEAGVANGDTASHTALNSLGDTTLTNALAATHLNNTVKVVLPYAEPTVEKAVDELLRTITDEQLTGLNHVLYTAILAPRGGLIATCKAGPDLMKTLAGPLVDQTTAYLGEFLPVSDVAEVEMSLAKANIENTKTRIANYVKAAAKVAGGPDDEGRTFVMVPDTHKGNEYAQLVKKVLSKAITVPVMHASTDLLFCRERTWLKPTDVWQMLAPYWNAYVKYSQNPDLSPHSRFDVTHWLPLNPESPVLAR